MKVKSYEAGDKTRTQDDSMEKKVCCQIQANYWSMEKKDNTVVFMPIIYRLPRMALNSSVYGQVGRASMPGTAVP